MKFNKKSIAAFCLLLVAMLLVTGCSGNQSPYAKNDAENFTVSVRFDANGGLFATNTSVVMDSYNISGLQTNSNGDVELPLITPDDPIRDREGFEPYYSGYFLAGWYAERTQVGENEYTYSKKWDFAKDRVKVPANGNYSSSEPVLTLYAVWIPSFTVEYYDLASGELLDTETYNPMTRDGIVVPQWNEGKIKMNDFPKHKGYTFNGVFLDAEGTIPATDAVIAHCGVVNEENGTGSNGTMKLYVDWIDGEWYRIETAEQFEKLADPDANYEILGDLDFTNVKWPSKLTRDEFTGTIVGNGYTFNNLPLSDKALFKEISEDASISGLTFSFAVKEGESALEADMKLVCEEISENAEIMDVQVHVIVPESAPEDPETPVDPENSVDPETSENSEESIGENQDDPVVSE